MTDIHGNPEASYPEPHYVYVPVYPYRPIAGTPFVSLGAEFMDSAVFMLYIAFALLYAFGFINCLPRTGWHDALAAAGVLPSLLAATCWPSVRRIPTVGPVLYFLPGLALATLPFAFDFYLMFGR